MDVALANLRALERRYLHGSLAPVAAATVAAELRSPGSIDLDSVLRHHDDEEVVDETEVFLRDAFDDLLAYYGLVEVGSLLGVLPRELPGDMARTAREVLETPEVHRYYTRRYPLLLPDLLRRRVVGSWSRRLDVDAAEAPSLFARFLDVNAVLDAPSQTDEVEAFLWLLDGGSWGTADLSDMIKLLRNPKRVTDALRTPAEDADKLELAVHGFREFLVFCTSLDALLQSCPPPAAAAFWHQHAYWFRIVRRDVASAVDEAIEALSGWRAPAANARTRRRPRWAEPLDLERERRDAKQSMDALRTTVRRLTSGAYGAPMMRPDA